MATIAMRPIVQIVIQAPKLAYMLFKKLLATQIVKMAAIFQDGRH